MRRKNPWKVELSRHPWQYAAILFLIALYILPSILLLILVTFALRQLHTAPGLVPWNELVGEHVSRWLIPIVRNTNFEAGLSLEFQIEWAALFLVCVGTITCLCKFGQEYLLEDLGEKVSRNLRIAVTERFAAMTYQDAKKVDGALLASFMGEDTKEVRMALTRLWGSVVSESLSAFVFTAWLILLDTQLFILFITILLPSAVVLRFTSKSLKKLSRQGIDYQKSVLAIILERIRGWQTIQSYRAVDFEVTQFSKSNSDLFHTWRRAARARALGTPLVEWLGVIAASLVIVVALRRIADDALSSHVLTGFLVTIGFLSNSVQTVSSQIQASKKASAILGRLDEFIQSDHGEKGTSQESAEIVTSATVINDIEFKDVVLTFPSSTEKTEILNARVKKGDHCVIVGRSGAGKSTLLRVILGVESSGNGAVLINGTDSRRWSADSLKNRIVFLPQEPFVFDGTVFENVVYPLHADFQDAAVKAQVTECLGKARLGKSLETNAATLSGGEKQRLMFARCFFNKPELLIIDEATSALDEENERAILNQMMEEMRNSIVIAVAHRSVVKEFATQIVDLSKGHI